MKICPPTEVERGERGKDVFKGVQVSKRMQSHQGINFCFFFSLLFCFLSSLVGDLIDQNSMTRHVLLRYSVLLMSAFSNQVSFYFCFRFSCLVQISCGELFSLVCDRMKTFK